MFKHLVTRYTYLKMDSPSNAVFNIKTFAFFDLETTGLPFQENNTTKITELCLTTVHAEHIRLGVFPRVQNKLSLCFNPWKLISEDSEKLTGLSNSLLEQSSRFSKETVAAINSFLSHNPQPICLVAHNGNHFDYPLFKREIEKTNCSLLDNILCVDSLLAFREIEKNQRNEITKQNIDEVDRSVPVEFTPKYDELLFSCEAQAKNETTPRKQIIRQTDTSTPTKKLKPIVPKILNFSGGYKLGDVYSRLTKKEPIGAHQADADAQMLIMCAATLGDTFVDWCNQNAKKLCDIPTMVPGRKIGT
ncbi:three-prime repair exonuclease 1 isoform X2 [Diorhabda sublineata]|uniref:three-prime repair exonuclease 1 isoform X2 n=1 Tax=Diorhabda sublineata TaxID=1163346 RepID=UPI0024E0BE71|nr:three-prime repair exonuclease 1 isoform X2 [Diorhabda sublineata]